MYFFHLTKHLILKEVVWSKLHRFVLVFLDERLRCSRIGEKDVKVFLEIPEALHYADGERYTGTYFTYSL